jgi:uncharacterized repeat protein (TIGR02543 family)
MGYDNYSIYGDAIIINNNKLAPQEIGQIWEYDSYNGGSFTGTYTYIGLCANGSSVYINGVTSHTVTYDSSYRSLKIGDYYLRYYDSGWTTTSDIYSASQIDLYVETDELYTPPYTIYFNANGGSVSPSSKYVVNGETYGELPTPYRSGYGFAGWYTSRSGGTQITSSTSASLAYDGQTLYAHWGYQCGCTWCYNATDSEGQMCDYCSQSSMCDLHTNACVSHCWGERSHPCQCTYYSSCPNQAEMGQRFCSECAAANNGTTLHHHSNL